MGRSVLCVACHEAGSMRSGVQAESPSANQAFPVVANLFSLWLQSWQEEALMNAGDKVLDCQKRLEANQEQGAATIEATLSARVDQLMPSIHRH